MFPFRSPSSIVEIGPGELVICLLHNPSAPFERD
jgi:hypothetical protein